MQAISRDILSYAIRTLSHCFICGHVHDELIIECSKEVSLDAVCDRWEEHHPGQRDWSCVRMGMRRSFIRKTDMKMAAL